MLSTKWRYCSLQCKMDALAMARNSSDELSCATRGPSLPTLAAAHADPGETQPKAGGLQGQAAEGTAGRGRATHKDTHKDAHKLAHKHAAMYGPALPPAAAAAVAAHTACQVTLGLAAMEIDWEVEEEESAAHAPPQMPLYIQAKGRRLAAAEPRCIKKTPPAWALQHPGGLPQKEQQALANCKLITGLGSAGLGAVGHPAEARAL
jgi:hypothetical protein